LLARYGHNGSLRDKKRLTPWMCCCLSATSTYIDRHQPRFFDRSKAWTELQDLQNNRDRSLQKDQDLLCHDLRRCSTFHKHARTQTCPTHLFFAPFLVGFVPNQNRRAMSLLSQRPALPQGGPIVQTVGQHNVYVCMYTKYDTYKEDVSFNPLADNSRNCRFAHTQTRCGHSSLSYAPHPNVNLPSLPFSFPCIFVSHCSFSVPSNSSINRITWT